MRTAALFLLFSAVALGDPPKLDIPKEIAPSQGYAKFVPSKVTTAKAITYIGLSGKFPVPSEVLKDPRVFVLPTEGLGKGRYRFLAVGSLNDEHATTEFEVVVGDAPKPIDPVIPPNPVDPVNPPPPDGRLGLTKVTYEAAKKVTSGKKAAVLAAWSSGYRSVASAIAAGGVVDGSGNFSPGLALKQLKEAGDKAIQSEKESPQSWLPLAAAMSDRLKALVQENKLLTKTEWAEAVREMAAGMVP